MIQTRNVEFKDIIKLIDDYRDELADRRGRKEHYQFIELNDKGYINAMDEVIFELHEIIEKIKLMEQVENMKENK